MEAQPFAGPAQTPQEGSRSVPVFDSATGHQNHQEQPPRIHQQLTFAALDLLGGIIAALTWHEARLHTLAVQAAGRGLLVAAGILAHLCPHGVVDALPGLVATPLAKVVISTLPFRAFSWQHPPGNAPYHDILDGIGHQAHLQLAWTTARLCWRHQFRDNMPLAVGHIGCVKALFAHTTDLLPD